MEDEIAIRETGKVGSNDVHEQPPAIRKVLIVHGKIKYSQM
jgi:hypothetical protein